MEQFFQVLFEAAASFSWWQFLLILGYAVIFTSFGRFLSFFITEFEISTEYFWILFDSAIKLFGFACLCAGPFLKYPEEVHITIIAWPILWFLVGMITSAITKSANN